MLLLACDVGNTNVTVGLWDGDALRAEFRLTTDTARTADEYAVQMDSLLLLHTDKTLRQVEAVALGSVSPRVTQTLSDMTRRYTKAEPFVVRAGGGATETGLILRYTPPESLGADRLINAFAAYEMYGKPAARPCIVVDYGTATKIEWVSADGVYGGGVILPGAGISMDALFGRAALLRQIDLTIPPASVIGTNTADALRAGILLGYGAQTDGLVAQVAEEGNSALADIRVIATGGLAPLIAPYARTVQTIDTCLTLIGLRLLHERHHTHP